ncbi:triphosphoribosyl-dephospho-CoA synthase [Bradyrhizobium sp. LB13.1]
MLTPKPGLVDRRNCGAHHDMDMHTFLASARAIAPWWPRFVEIGNSCGLYRRECIALAGTSGRRALRTSDAAGDRRR